MGFLDDARRAKELRQADPNLSNSEALDMIEREKRDSRTAAFSQYFAPGAVHPYIEEVPYKVWRKDREAFVKTYIAILGLQPEDTFGIYISDEESAGCKLRFVYRDRPEYQQGRLRYRRAVLGE